MATKKEATEETKEVVQDAAYWNERVPYKIPIDRLNNADVFVSVNDYTAYIKRGVEVMIPRNVAAVLDQSDEAQYEAFQRQQQLTDDFEEEAKKLGA